MTIRCKTCSRVLAKRCRPSVCHRCSCKINLVLCQRLPVSGQLTVWLGASTCPEVGFATARGTHQPAQSLTDCRRTASLEVGTARKRSGGVLDSLQVSERLQRARTAHHTPSAWQRSSPSMLQQQSQGVQQQRCCLASREHVPAPSMKPKTSCAAKMFSGLCLVPAY